MATLFVLLTCLKPILIGGDGAKKQTTQTIVTTSPSCVSQPADGLDQCCHLYALFSPSGVDALPRQGLLRAQAGHPGAFSSSSEEDIAELGRC